MRHRPNALTVLTPLLLAAGCLVATTPALAQQTRPGEVMGMRYLSWSGKVDAPADGLRRSNEPTSAPTPVAASGSRYPGIQTAGRPSRYGAGLAGPTPASVWTGPGRAPATGPATPALEGSSQPDGNAQSQADYQAQIQSRYQAWYQSEAQAQYESQVQAMPQPQQQVVRVPAPEQQTQQQQALDTQQPQPQYQQQADAGLTPTNDPMAPRRDAPIFRMQQPQSAAQPQPPQLSGPTPQPTAPGQAAIETPVLTQPVAGRTPSGQAYAGAEPPRESARYYSVHRVEGRQPDPISMPESVYLDNAPIDLAEPPAAPTPTRTINGRTQLVVPNQDPALP